MTEDDVYETWLQQRAALRPSASFPREVRRRIAKQPPIEMLPTSRRRGRHVATVAVFAAASVFGFARLVAMVLLAIHAT